MADVNSNININFNTAAALAQLRSLQAGLSKFHQTLAEGNLAAANAQKGLNAQLLQSVGATGKFSASQVKVAGSTLAFTSALEKNKLSLREYYRYTMAAATANTRVMGRAFAQEREIINRARRDRVKALQSQYIQMNKANSGFIDAIRIMPKSLQMASGKFTELGTRIQYAAQRQQFLNQLLKQGSTQLLNFGKNTQWAGRQLMVGLTMPLALFGAAAAKSFKDLEAEIVKFRRVYGNAFTNDAEVEEAIAGIRRLGTEYTKYGVSVTKTMEMAALAAAAGFTGSALTAQVETATKLSVLGNVEQQQALETTISLQSAFGISSDELAKKIDFLNAVENQTLLSIEDLTIAIPKAAPVVKQLGGTVEDLAFFLTAMKEGGINASEGANALKSGLASLINPSDKAAKFLGNLGINIKGIVEGNAGDIKGTVVGFAQALDTLDPLNRARAIEQMFGKFQFSRLSTLFQNVTKEGTQASRALDLASSSMEELAVMSEREMKKIEDATGVKFQAAIENFKQEIMPLGKAFLEALTPVVKFFGGLFEKFNSLSDKTKKVIATIIAVVAGLGPIVLMTFGLLANGIANVIKFFAMLRGGIAKLNGQTSVMGAGFNYMTQEQIENAASSQSLHQTHTRLIEVFNVEKASVSALASSYNFLSTQMRSMAAQNPALFAGGMSGAKGAVSKLPPVRKYVDGVISVPGPKGAGDVVPAMLSPGEAVIPTETTDKYRGLITAMFQDKVPGFMAGRIPGGPGRGIPLSAGPEAFRNAQQAKYRRINDARQGYSGSHSEKQVGPNFVGMPKGYAEASQSRQILDKISNQVKAGRFADVPPTNFGTKLQNFTGYSFPARGVGGVFRKPNGQIVVVKPTMTEATADAEVRMTQIEAARGMVVPRQTIKTMLDPTDPTGKRKFIVLESPYDPRIAAMDGKFSKTDMVKQLVGSAIRGDKDLQKANVSGNVVADVGNAGVMDRASGFREFAKTMPSMEEQAMINLLGVKGGAKKFFAQETSSTAAKMTPKEYGAAIRSEINSNIPKIEKLIKSWNLKPDEQIVYNNMLKRLKDGAKVDWEKFQPIHARAGQGVIKAEHGIHSVATNSMVEEQIQKYMLPSETESQRSINNLKETVNKEFLEKLKTSDPDRARIIKAAWFGGSVDNVPPEGRTKTFTSPRQADFINEISKMTPINVDGVTKYLHPDDMNSFMSDPNGRAKYARTSQEVRDMLLYRMGVVPNKKGRLVAGGKFEGRFGQVEHYIKSLRSTGKESGGGIGNISKIVKPFAEEELERYNKRVGNPLKTKTGKAMLAAGFTENEVRDRLRPNISHITKEVTGSTSGAKKMKTGNAFYDTDMLNKYMNGTQRSSKILNNKSITNALKLSEIEKAEYRKAADFMAKGNHPVNAKERALLAKAVELDQRLVEHHKKTGTYRNYLPQDLRIPKALQTLFSDSSFQSGRLLNLQANDAANVLVKRGEFDYDKPNKTLEKLGQSNTKTPARGLKPDSKKQSDNRLRKESPGHTTVTASQAARLAQGSGVRIIRSRDKGDPNVKITSADQLSNAAQRRINAGLAQKARMLATENKLTGTQIQRAIEKIKMQRTEAELTKAKIYQEKQAIAAAQKNAPQTRKAAIKEKRMARQQKIGGISGGLSMGLGTAGMGLMMAGQQTAGMAVMGASAVAGLAPMFAGMGPTGLIATGVVAVGASLFLLNKHLENSAKKQVQFVESMSATTSKMEKIGVITNKVGASRSMDEVRKRGVFGKYNDVERAGTGFGDTFLSSEVGKSMVSGFVKNMETSGSKAAAQDFALELSAYVSDGVLNEAQASDIANQIGIKLGSRKYPVEIMGNLRSIIGINGEDLTKDPLKVRMQIVDESNKRSKNIVNRLSDAENSGNSGRTESAQLAALAVNNLSIAKAQADATEFQYIKQIQLLEKELESTTNAEKMLKIKQQIAVLEGKMVADVTVTNKAYSDQLDKEVKRFNDTIRQEGTEGLGLKEDAYFDALKGKIKDVYKDTDFATAAAKSLEKLSRLSDSTRNPFDGAKTKGGFENQATAQDFEVRMSMLLADRVMNPEQLDNFMAMFSGDLAKLQTSLDLGIKRHGPAATVEMLDYFTSIDEDGDTVEIAAKITQSNKADFKAIGEALAQLSVLDGREINLSLFLKQEGGFEKLLELSKDLAVVEKMPDKMSKEAILKYFTTGNGAGVKGLSKENLETLMGQWKDFSKLPAKAQKEAISKFTTLYATVFADKKAREDYAEAEGDKAARESGFRGRTAGAIKKKRIDEVLKDTVGSLAKSTETYIGQYGEKVTNPVTPYTPDPKGGKNPLDFIDELAMRLKQVKDNAFNALTPIESLIAALTNKQDVKDAFNLFDGIQNRLLKLGVGQGLRDAVSSMSAKEFAEVAELKGNKALFTFETDKPRSKDTITGLAQGGKAVDKGYYQRDLGNFNLQNEEIVKNINDQNTAYKILISNGLTASQALEAVADQGTAAALAAGEIKNSDPGWKTFIDNIKTSNTALERQAALNKIRKANEDFKFQENSIGFAKSFFEAGLSMQQIQDILSDPQMAALLVEDLKDGKIEAEGMQEYLDNIPKRIDVEVNAKLAQGDFLGAAGPGFDIIDKMFATQESLIEHAGKAKTKPIIEEIEALEVVIEAIKTEIKLRASLTDVVNEQGIAAKALGNTNSLSYDQLVEAANVIQKALEDEQRELEISPVFGSRGIDALNEEINDINRTLEMDPVFGTRAIDKINEEIDSINRELEVDPKIGTRFVDELNEKIDDADRELELNPVFGTRAIETLQEESSVLSNDLEVMNYAAEKINEEYDKQAEALQKVSEINQDIVEQQKQQIDLAGALTSGDIAAAAQAAQQMRQSSASRYSEGISSALEQSRTNSVDGLRSPGGKTKKEIEERQYRIAQEIYKMETNPERVAITKNIKDIQDQIYSIEEEREKKVLAIQILEDKIYNTQAARKLLTDQITLLQDTIYTKEEAREKKLLEIQKIEDAMYAIKQEIAKEEGLLDKQNKKLVELNKQLDIAQKSIQNQIDNIKVMGKDKDGWDLAKTKLEAYNLAVAASATAMEGVLKATGAVESDWESINAWLTQWLGSDGSKINLETIHTITTVYNNEGSVTPPTTTDDDDAESEAEAEAFDAAVAWLDAAKEALAAYSGSGQPSSIAEYEALLADVAAAQANYDAIVNGGSSEPPGDGDGGSNSMQFESRGGLINPMRFASGGYARGTDTVPAMLTPGEFIMSKYAVQAHGIDTMKAINNGQSTGGAVYNNTYELTVNAKTDANPNEIAQAVMSTIRQVDDRRIRGVSLNAR